MAAICAAVGSAVACYNTAALGYDSAVLAKKYDGGIIVLDFDINYNKLKEKYRNLNKFLPDEYIAI
ncbi:MAG: hypothetical protein K6C14_00420 [Eubacterium sp.]|nr:hypothetical protein [Eubacterium sp.]